MTTRSKELGIDPVGLQYRNTFERAWHTTYQDHAMQLRQLGRADDVREVFDERAIEAAYQAGLKAAGIDAQRWGHIMTGQSIAFSGKTEKGKDWHVYLAGRDMHGWRESFVAAVDTALLNASTPDPK